ncbi:MAG: hypothetical protein H0V72_05260 [Bradyrhizobium sp.]|nr:hypothetical protein [Bradyrhizobium sp.]
MSKISTKNYGRRGIDATWSGTRDEFGIDDHGGLLEQVGSRIGRAEGWFDEFGPDRPVPIFSW